MLLGIWGIFFLLLLLLLLILSLRPPTPASRKRGRRKFLLCVKAWFIAAALLGCSPLTFDHISFKPGTGTADHLTLLRLFSPTRPFLTFQGLALTNPIIAERIRVLIPRHNATPGPMDNKAEKATVCFRFLCAQ